MAAKRREFLEEMGGHRPEDESAHVCQVGHAAGLYLGDGASVYQLHEEPGTDQERRRALERFTFKGTWSFGFVAIRFLEALAGEIRTKEEID